MFKKKEINYSIGILFGACILGFAALPLTGEACSYSISLALFDSYVLWQTDPLFMIMALFMFFTLIISGLILVFGILGLILTVLKNNKFEKVVSRIYSTLFPASIICLIVAYIFIYSMVSNPEQPYQLLVGFYLLASSAIILPSIATVKIRSVVLGFSIFLFLLTLGTIFSYLF